MRLNSIGPAAAITRRSDAWCVRFRLPAESAENAKLGLLERGGPTLVPPGVDESPLQSMEFRAGHEDVYRAVGVGQDVPAGCQQEFVEAFP